MMLSAAAHPAAVSRDAWVGAWGFASTSFIPTKAPTATSGSPPPNFDNITVRQIVRIVPSANRIRTRISNEFGDQPMHIGSVHIALAGEDGATLPGSDHVLTFSNQPGASLAAGAPLLSDALGWKVPRMSKLAIDVTMADAVDLKLFSRAPKRHTSP